MLRIMGDLREIHDVGPDLMEFLVYLQNEIDKD